MQYIDSGTTRSVYIHWPFCPYKCHFCPFVALASHDQFMEQYHTALCAEIRSYDSPHMPHLDTIFLGGGTPSTYPDALLLDMLGILKERFSFSRETEVTIEVNPGTVRAEQMDIWKEAGINRLSIGVQSLKDGVLQKLNRHQTVKDVEFVIQKAQRLFDNLSVDLILGLPEVSHQDWKDTLNQIVHWPLKHISMYFLTVHEDTPLYFKVQQKKVQLPSDDAIVDLYHWSCDLLAQHDFIQYELSNFAKKGYESRHNSAYWDRRAYKGFGLGAHSFDGVRRLANEKNLMQYMQKASRGENVSVFCETLSESQVRLEMLMLSLRRAEGLSWEHLLKGLNESLHHRCKEHVSWLIEQNFIIENNGRLRLSPTGLVVENDIVARLSLCE